MTALKPIAGFFIWAMLVSTLVFFAAYRSNNIFYQRNPILGDTASYWQRDGNFVRLAEKQATGYWERQAKIIDMNPKDPLRGIAFSVLPAEAPYTLNGHLPYASFALFAFLFTMSLMLYHRTGSWAYAAAAPLAILLTQVFFNPMYGFTSKLPDMIASLLMASAIFTLFAGIGRTRELTWVLASGLLLGVATLARYHVWIYGLFIMGPIVFALGCQRFHITKQKYWPVLYPALLMGGLMLVSGWFLISKTQMLMEFYKVAGYGLNATVITSVQTTGKLFFTHTWGASGFMALGFLCMFYVLFLPEGRKPQRLNALLVWWVAMAYPILALGIMKVDNIVEQTFYASAGVLIAMLVPVPRTASPLFKRYAFLLLLWMPLIIFMQYHKYTRSEDFIYPRPDKAAHQEMQTKLSEFIAVQAKDFTNRNLIVDSNFQYYTRYLMPIVRGKYGTQFESGTVFEIRESQWLIAATGMSDAEKAARHSIPAERVAQAAYGRLNNDVDLFLALGSVTQDMVPQTFADEYTRDVAAKLNAKIEKNPHIWQVLGKSSSPYGAEVVVYKNLARMKQ